jgi:hypothetical protein
MKFTTGDVGKTVEVKNGAVTVDGIKRRVDWGESKHPDCNGKIKSVETSVRGHVTLEDRSMLENCAILSVDELSTSALVYGWIKDSAITGDDRLADRPERDRPRFSDYCLRTMFREALLLDFLPNNSTALGRSSSIRKTCASPITSSPMPGKAAPSTSLMALPQRSGTRRTTRPCGSTLSQSTSTTTHARTSIRYYT